MMINAQTAIVDYLDNEEQTGRRVELGELVDVVRGLDDAPRDEKALTTLVRLSLERLLDDGTIVMRQDSTIRLRGRTE